MTTYLSLPTDTPIDEKFDDEIYGRYARHCERGEFLNVGDWKRSIGSAVDWYLRVVEHVAVIVLIILLAVNIGQSKSTMKSTSSTSSNQFVPYFPFNTQMTWKEDDRFRDSKNFNRLLQPRDGGFVSIPQPHRYGLSGGYPLNSTHEAYALSVFHALHCLHGLRHQIHLLKINDSSAYDEEHVQHCSEYLRQSIMCAGDTSLEPAYVNPKTGKREHRVEGEGVVHSCKNFDRIVDFANVHGDMSGDGPREWAGKDRAEEIVVPL